MEILNRLRSLLTQQSAKKAGSSASGEVIKSNRSALQEDSHGRSVSRLAGLHASTRFIELLLGLDLFS